MTENHDYNTPQKGTTDWDVPLNENFERLDGHVEVRDAEGERSNYEPKAGAKFFATDSGRVYVGDGSAWRPISATGPKPLFEFVTADSAFIDSFSMGAFHQFFTDYDSLELRNDDHIVGSVGPVTDTDENGTTVRNAPNIVAGYDPYVYGGVVGATIAGGGRLLDPDGGKTGEGNSVFGDYGTIGGGYNNGVRGAASVVSGGVGNLTHAASATVGGGKNNAANGKHSTVGGGQGNTVSGEYGTIPGGRGNFVTAATGFAAGSAANALHANTFVWNDGTDVGPTEGIESTGERQFLVYAQGGVGFGTNDPKAPVDVGGENNWNLTDTDGDVRIGNDDYRLGIGVSLGGGGRGTARIRAKGSDGSHRIKLGAGDTDTATVTDSSVKPSSDGGASLGTSGSRWSKVYAQSGTVSTSDARLKTGVETVADGMDRVKRLRPVAYRWDGDREDAPGDDGRRLGFLAQEVADVVPEAVELPEGDDEGYYGLDYGELVPVLTSALQEQADTLDDQRADITEKDERIDDLKGEVETLRDELASMKEALADGGLL